MNLALICRKGWLIGLIYLCACAHIDPTNPYDSDIDPEQRARGSLQGHLSATEYLEFFDYSQISLRLDLQLKQEDADSVFYTVDADEKGTFSFSQIVAGIYTLSGKGQFKESKFKIDPISVLIYEDETVQKTYFLRRTVD